MKLNFVEICFFFVYWLKLINFDIGIDDWDKDKTRDESDCTSESKEEEGENERITKIKDAGNKSFDV